MFWPFFYLGLFVSDGLAFPDPFLIFLDFSVSPAPPPVVANSLLSRDSMKIRTQALKWPAMTSLSFIVALLSFVLYTTHLVWDRGDAELVPA